MRPVLSPSSSPRRSPHDASKSSSTGTGARMLLYLIGIGCFCHVLFVAPPQAPNVAKPTADMGESSHPTNHITSKDDGMMDEMDGYQESVSESQSTADASPVEATKTTSTDATALAVTTAEASENSESDSCPEIQTKDSTKLYREQFLQNYPVKVPIVPVDDWDAIPCSNMPQSCDLQDLSYGHPFLMISFGRSGTTSTWDIIAALTGEYIPRASEDMGRDKTEGYEFFHSRNETEHGKCWLERLLCEKQEIVKKAHKDGLGKAAIFGSKWKPWHLGLNTTQAREALQWLGTQKQIKILHNTRNMIDMFISQFKHVVLRELFGDERTAHCYDDRDIKLSERAWTKLEEMGIERGTPCVRIFKEIEARTSLDIGHMFDYFERNGIQTDYVIEMLDYYGISRVTVTYEKLYFTDNAEEWMRIFRHLGFGPQQNLTLDQVFAKTAFQKTSANDRSKRMANYDEVSKALRCTRYGKYLD